MKKRHGLIQSNIFLKHLAKVTYAIPKETLRLGKELVKNKEEVKNVLDTYENGSSFLLVFL